MSFANAPVTKCYIVSLGVTSLTAGLFNLKHYFNVPLSPHLTRDLQFWRLFTQHLAFTNSSELFIAALLLYNIGIPIERAFGSAKYASLCFLSAVLGSFLELLLLVCGHRFGMKSLPAGPYVMVFALLYQYYRILPAIFSFRIFGFTMTNKTFNYFFGFQLMSCQLPISVLSALSGCLAGLAIRSELFALRDYRLPSIVFRLSEKWLRPFVGGDRSRRRSTRTSLADAVTRAQAATSFTSALQSSGQNLLRRGGNAEPPGALRQFQNAFVPPTQRAAVDPAALSTLQAMFSDRDRGSLESALRNANGNVQAATEALLSANT